MHFTHHFTAVFNGQPERLFFAVFLNRETCAFLNPRLRAPRYGIAFVFCPIRPLFHRIAHTQLAGGVPRIRFYDASFSWFLRHLLKLLARFFFMLSSQLVGGFLAATFSIAEKFGICLSVPIATNKPAMRRTGINTANSLIFFLTHVDTSSYLMTRSVKSNTTDLLKAARNNLSRMNNVAL